MYLNATCIAGKSLISAQDLYDSVSFEAHSQTLYPFYPSLKDKPKASCKLYIKDADQLKKMDDETYNVARFLSMGYYGLSENGTAIHAASGRLVDEILDIKARDILLQSKLDSQYAYEVTVFNIENMSPGYDVLRRFQKLAAETKFLFVIEFDGKIWAKNQNFRNVQANRIKTINLYKESLREHRSLAQNVRGIQIPNSGHWGPEERPDFVIKMLDNFFAGNSTKTSK